MTDWSACDRPGTWGGFVAYAARHGAVVKSLDTAGGFRYLERVVQGEALRYPIPHACAPDRRMGFMRYSHVCQRLRLPEPKWPVVM